MRILALLFCLGGTALAGAGADWDNIVAMDAGPGVQPKSAEEARALSVEFTAKQEKALRAFLAAYPGDEHDFEVRLRLARLLALRADLQGQAVPPESGALIAEAAKMAKTPAEHAEADFAVLSRQMRASRGQRPTAAERREILGQVRAFAAAHAGDRRLGSLFAEVATLYDGDPETKQQLLDEAKKQTKDPDVLAQIADDTKRLGWLGRALPLRFTGLDGVHVDVKEWRGKPVVVVFFATPSAPSLKVFAQMRQLAEENGARFVGVSLDGDGSALSKFLAEQKGSVPVAWDGKGWDSPLITALGVNAVPSVWLLDKKGVVRTLDPLDAPGELLRKLSK